MDGEHQQKDGNYMKKSNRSARNKNGDIDEVVFRFISRVSSNTAKERIYKLEDVPVEIVKMENRTEHSRIGGLYLFNVGVISHRTR